ncbi:response regulator transcription factor [Thermosulfurimonas marina]|uniref:Phosphate regulon transcriptional regulatory protein PhoB n=1 Tax=Thermosulfurimonas marina TaxID=2047767 RepID=A0A6H1WRR5_9BACT|nr:response regulator transcription factor [Thermosulfurimonas marina]QJA05883.1 response regulator transcription factor [Thermosulfurimonas marina]
MAARVLIVEDEPEVAELERRAFEREGFRAEVAGSASEAFRRLAHGFPDLVILDLMLPDQDGLEILKFLRFRKELSRVPVIIVSARGEEVDRVLGFELGADDYVVKPFSPRELVLRAKAILKRLRPPSEGQILAHGPLRLFPEEFRAEVEGQEVRLTPMEFKLLQTFMEAPGRVFSRETLLEKVWGYTYQGYARTVDTHVKRLRKKLGPAASLLETIWGVGYRLRSLSGE